MPTSHRRYRSAISLLGAAATLGGCVASRASNARAAAHELVQLEHRILDASVAHDSTFLRDVEAPEYVFTTAGGARMRKGAEVVFMRDTTAPILRGGSMDSMSVRIYGETAVVLGTLRTSWTRRSGRDFTIAAHFLDVFARRDGRWQIVAGQVTRVP